MTRLILVRHGQTDWNVRERYRGRLDVPLNPTGIHQAQLTARRIAESWKVTAVYSSPLRRALATAQAIAAAQSLSVTVVTDLADVNFGSWEGLSPDEVRARWPDLFAAWHSAPHTVRLPGGETLDEVRQRCHAALGRIASVHAEQTVVAVAHTDYNRVLVLTVLGLGSDRLWRLRQDNCAINEIEIDRGHCTLVSMNDTCHLHDMKG
jgi:broad specificity phosphatase PhoE